MVNIWRRDPWLISEGSMVNIWRKGSMVNIWRREPWLIFGLVCIPILAVAVGHSQKHLCMKVCVC